MTDFGIKISKPGVDVKGTPTETTKKDFIILDSTNAHKIVSSGFTTTGTFTHDLGIIPFYLSWKTDGTSSPTFFEGEVNSRAGTADITGLPGTAYVIVFNEGG